MYILDHNLEPLPPGTTGEIFIGGDGLARGYLARPGLTAERFIPNPWSHSSNSLADNLSDRRARVYIGPATLGVMDRTVPLSFLAGPTNRSKCAAIALSWERSKRSSINTQWRAKPSSQLDVTATGSTLIAYVVPKMTDPAAKPPTVGELRGFLEAKMPDYMVPNMYVLLDALPLTASGKIDRAALPGPDQADARSRAGSTAPRTLEEEVLAAVWCNVLGLEQVGIDDSYFYRAAIRSARSKSWVRRPPGA